MKRYLCTLLILFYALVAYAQNQGLSNIWLSGYGSGSGVPFGVSKMDFYSGVPLVTQYPIPMDFRHTLANISDSQGNLLFYTNGYYIADATNDTMQNGSGINPGSYADAFSDGFMIPQGCLIIPKPGSPNLYYLFHNTVDGYPNLIVSFKLSLSVIDMNQNLGLGSVIIKNFQVLNDSLMPGKIISCKHANGRDWWVLCHGVNNNKYFKILLTPNGYNISSQNIGAVRASGAGQVKFSNNGEFLSYYNYLGGLDIFHFDRCTGNLILLLQDSIPTHIGNVGEEFAPNSTKLYVSNATNVYQYDLTDTSNILATKNIVADWDTFYDPQPPIGTYLCLQQLAPDGKIYITSGNSTHYMHVINYPDSLGSSCDIIQHGIQLPTIYFNTLPNPPNYFLGALTGSPCDTLVGVGIEEQPPEINISAFPNPATDKITFWFPVKNDSGELKIYDVLGNVVINEPVAPWSQYKTVDISAFNSGIYFCKMRWKASEGTVKIVVSND